MKQTILRNKRFRYLLNTIAIALLYLLIVLLTSGGVLNRYQSNLFIQIGYNIIQAVSLNLSCGFLGQLPLGHAGFMSVGAYASALFSMAVDLPVYIELPAALLIGGIAAGIAGVIIGLPALRLRGDYLAIITLGFGEIIRVVLLNLKFTGGAFGLRGIEKHSNISWVFLFTVISIFVIHTLLKSRHGRAVISIREDEIAAEASGISLTYYKTVTFAISASFAGVAGGLYAHYLCILDPGNFGFMKSVEILVMVVLGGLGSIIGSVISASVLTVIPELLRSFADYRMVIYSLLLVIVMIFRPSGLFGRYDFSLGPAIDTVFGKIRRLILRKGGAKNK